MKVTTHIRGYAVLDLGREKSWRSFAERAATGAEFPLTELTLDAMRVRPHPDHSCLSPSRHAVLIVPWPRIIQSADKTTVQRLVFETRMLRKATSGIAADKAARWEKALKDALTTAPNSDDTSNRALTMFRQSLDVVKIGTAPRLSQDLASNW